MAHAEVGFAQWHGVLKKSRQQAALRGVQQGAGIAGQTLGAANAVANGDLDQLVMIGLRAVGGAAGIMAGVIGSQSVKSSQFDQLASAAEGAVAADNGPTPGPDPKMTPGNGASWLEIYGSTRK